MQKNEMPIYNCDTLKPKNNSQTYFTVGWQLIQCIQMFFIYLFLILSCCALYKSKKGKMNYKSSCVYAKSLQPTKCSDSTSHNCFIL